MLHIVIFLIIYFSQCDAKLAEDESSGSDSDLGGKLVSVLRDDVNLDLSEDEEYEDLRAELLAYHSALASLASSRRSLVTTPCWALGGICIDHKLCTGFRSLSEVPGCKDKLKVCCFGWNHFNVRDMREHGIRNPVFPWNLEKAYGGKGIIAVDKKIKKSKKNKPKYGRSQVLAVVLN